jgi:hypothetical protein
MALTDTFDLSGFRGPIYRPDHPGYDEARSIFNGMIDRRPAFIARCSDADDVVILVNLARENHLPLSAATASPARRSSTPASARTCGA